MIAETVLQMCIRGNSRRNLHERQGDYLDQVHSDQMVPGSRDSQAGRLDQVRCGQKQLKGCHPARVHYDPYDGQAGRLDRVSSG